MRSSTTARRVPHYRAKQASPAERAKDLHTAFSDPEIRAVLTSIGGEDEIKVLRHLDPEVLAGNPKPFFGYSDNTNLHLFLWNLGLVSYQGGAVMVQFGRPGSMHPVTRQSIEQALFTRGSYVLDSPPTTTMRKVTGVGTLPSPRPTAVFEVVADGTAPKRQSPAPPGADAWRFSTFSSRRAATCSPRPPMRAASCSARLPRSCRQPSTCSGS